MPRGRRVPRPTQPGRWEIRFWRDSVEKDWNKLVAAAENNVRATWDWLSEKPRERTDRNHPLKGELGYWKQGKLQYDRWQHEVTGGARIWFLIDDDRRAIYIEQVHTSHPKKTE
jgi:mRNA-degrading endonuclease RelE of RelBE toxin-antitoxin system